MNPDDSGRLTLDLPMPPTTNTIWRRGMNRKTGAPITYLNPTYKKWKERADAELKDQLHGAKPVMITGPFDVVLTLPLHKRFKIDLDNRIKAALDWAKQAGLIVDDKFQNSVLLNWGDAPKGARMTISKANVRLDEIDNSKGAKACRRRKSPKS